MKGIEYNIYIGLKDKETYEEIFDVDAFAKILSKHCTHRKIGFSLLTQLGGYSHDKGYTTETSLRISLIGCDEKTVYELGDQLKELINTDTIMITSNEIEYEYK